MSLRRVLTLAVLVLVAVVFVGQVRRLLADPTIWPPDDFIEYWAAARLTLDGQNPYDPALLLPLQQANGRGADDAVMMWNPPWALAVVLPLSLFPAREAQLLWLAVNVAAVGYCGDRLWRLFGGSAERRWVGWTVVLVAMPTLFALQSGQIGPLLLLGAVLFLECQRRGWHFAAGAATVLLAIKPHLAYLVWAAILCDAVARGRWRVVTGGAAAGLACAVVPLAFNPHVWQQYAFALGTPPAQWISPTLGTLLRLLFGAQHFGLQFVPVIAGLGWFAWHWRKHAGGWDWTEQLPVLLLVSFVTAPYGAWPFDMVLLLPAVMRLAARCHSSCVTPTAGVFRPLPCKAGGEGWGEGVVQRPLTRLEDSPTSPPQSRGRGEEPARGRFVLAGLVVVNVGCLVLNVLHVSSFWFIWVSPVVLLLYAVGHPRTDAKPGLVPA